MDVERLSQWSPLMNWTVRFVSSLLLVVASAPLAQAQGPDPCTTSPQSCATTISTRATASKRIPNSAVDVAVGVAASDKDLATVQRQLAQHAASLLAYLRGQKVERLMTSGVNVSPQVQYEKNGQNRIVGYNGSTSVSFRTTPQKAPETLTGVLTNGANTINSTSFTATEEEIRAAQRELSAEAVRSAIAQASAMAKAAEMHVVAVKSINVENQGSYNPRPVVFAKMAVEVAGAAPAPIDTAAGDQDVTVGVDVVVAARP